MNINRKQIISLIVLVIGLIVGLTLVGTKQIFKGRASLISAPQSVLQQIKVDGQSCEIAANGVEATCTIEGDQATLDLSRINNLAVPAE